jgi:hypothetical protein
MGGNVEDDGYVDGFHDEEGVFPPEWGTTPKVSSEQETPLTKREQVALTIFAGMQPRVSYWTNSRQQVLAEEAFAMADVFLTECANQRKKETTPIE